MKEITKIGAQGDVLFRRVASLPDGVVERKREGAIVVAHSETGHDHRIEARCLTHFEVPSDPLVCYLRMEGAGEVDVVHHRAWDTHETMRLLGKPGDVWEVRRQREWTPEGWQRVQD